MREQGHVTHCSAAYAVVPLPQVGSTTKSPGLVVIIMRSITFGLVWTTYLLSGVPARSFQTLVIYRSEITSVSFESHAII
jgi:hypothetical protein